MSEESETNKAEQIKRLLTLCEQLQNQKEQLASLVESLREQLSLAEARVAQLTNIVAESAEDLQQFGSNWFRPSAVVSVTEDTSGVMINGSHVGMGSQEGYYNRQKREIAQRINTLNQQKRRAAGLSEPEAET